MIEPLLGLPPHLSERLASALETGQLGPPYTVTSLRSVLGKADGIAELQPALAEFLTSVDGSRAAQWIRAVSRARSDMPRPDLVWSGPEVPGLHARDTRRVFEELVATSGRSLWISTYAFFDGPKAFDHLSRRMAERPELQVRLLLNIQRRRGDATPAGQVVRNFTERFWGRDWPGASRPEVFYDPRALEPEGPGAVLHAKAVVADEEMLLVTSANLTEAAFDRNIELGLLVRDQALAASVLAHFRVLIEQGLLRPMPGA